MARDPSTTPVELPYVKRERVRARPGEVVSGSPGTGIHDNDSASVALWRRGLSTKQLDRCRNFGPKVPRPWLGEVMKLLLTLIFALAWIHPASGQCIVQSIDGSPRFGWATVLQGDLLAVSNPEDSTFGTQSGRVDVYRRIGPHWVFEAELFPSDATVDDFFGHSIAISNGVIFVGCPNHDDVCTPTFPMCDGGRVYVFTHVNDEWQETSTLVPSDLQGGMHFGFSMDVSDDVLVVGTLDHVAYVFRRDADSWVEEQKLVGDDGPDHRFGFSVAVDGDDLIVGAPRHFGPTAQEYGTGAIYPFEFNGTDWIQTQPATFADGVPGAPGQDSLFGHAVHLADDVCYVGAPKAELCSFLDPDCANDSGVAFTFAKDAGLWVQGQTLAPTSLSPDAEFGTALHADGDRLVIGAIQQPFEAGKAYLFEFDTDLEEWVEHAILTGSPSSELGRSIHVQADTVVTGSNGRAYIFALDGAPLTTPFRRGDCNTDGAFDVGDAITLLTLLFKTDTAPPCRDACDANDDGALDVGDAILVLSTLFDGVSTIPPPSTGCGLDPSGDRICCVEYSSCL